MKFLTLFLLIFSLINLSQSQILIAKIDSTNKTGTVDITPIINIGMSFVKPVNTDSIYQAGYNAGFKDGVMSALDTVIIDVQGMKINLDYLNNKIYIYDSIPESIIKLK